MAYSQWVVIRITNSLPKGSIEVHNANVKWGRFHKNGNKEEELSADEINSIVIVPGKGAKADVSACGKPDSNTGTEGSLDLYEDNTKICTVYWDCPYNNVENNAQIQGLNSQAGYMVSMEPYNAKYGALGTVEVEVAKTD